MDMLGMLRRSLRQFRQQPLYALAVSGTLALAVASATASFAVVKRAFLDPLPYTNPAELVSVVTEIEGFGWALSAPVFEDLRATNPPIAEYAPVDPEGVTWSDGESAEQIVGAYTTPSFFATLGVQPAMGRTWNDGDRDVAVVSWRFWQEDMGAAPDAVGRFITINGTPHAVVAVLPQDFLPPYFTTAAVWMPLDMQPLMAGSGRSRRTLTTIARLTPGATVEELNAHLEVFTTQLRQAHPQIHGRQTFTARPLREELVGEAGTVLLGVGAAATLLLLIVFANVAGLSAARAVGTRHQVAVRLALGASRRQVLAERTLDSVVIALAGSIAGVWLGDTMVTLIAGYQQQFMPRLAPVATDWISALTGLGAGLLAGVAASAVPTGAGGVSSMEALRASRGSIGSRRASTVRAALVVTQVALALVLLVGAGLLVRTLHHVSTMALGFAADGLTVFSVTMPVPKYAVEERQLQYEREMLGRLSRIPGVQAASASVGFPVVGSSRASLSIFGRSDEGGRGEIAYMSIAPGFVGASGMRLLEGRGLLATDTETTPPVILINETMARQYWPGGDAVGAKVRVGPGTATPWITVVGIVADVSFHGPTQPVMPASFGSTYQYSWPRRHFSVRSDLTAAALAPELRAVVRAVDGDVPMGAIQTVDDMVDNQTGRHRLVMLALAFFGIVATVLCAAGLYAVVALTSQMRRREYAIRMALGAPREGVRWLVVRQAVRLGAIGSLAGLAVAALGTRALEGLLHGVTPLDRVTFVAAGLTMLMLAVLSAWLPARSAGRIDPSEALRE